MNNSSAADFVYARISGKLSKAFVGDRANKLFQVNSLHDLWVLLFNSEIPLVPESLLAKKIETEAEKRFIDDFCNSLALFSKPDPVALQLIRFYDYSNLKKFNYAVCRNPAELPELTDIGKFSQIKWQLHKDIAAMTSGTPFSWYTQKVEIQEQQAFEQKLDSQYIALLWQAVQKEPGEQRAAMEKIISEEIILNNILWAIRLRVYYNMNDDEIKAHLVWADKKNKNDILASPAIKTLSFATDSFKDWSDWQYADLINPVTDQEIWSIDPRWFQKSINVKINKQALKTFHKFPCSSAVLVPWFKIKQHELDCIRTAAEGLRLNIDSEQLKTFACVV